MSGQKSFQIAPGIVLRLRIVFLMISIVLFGALGVGFFQVQSLNRSVDLLTLSSIPVFVRAEETERSLKNLLLLLQKIESADQLSELNPLSERLTVRLSILHANTQEFSDGGPSEDVVEKLTEALNKIYLGSAEILETKTSIILHEELLKQRIEKLAVLRKTMRTLLEDLSYETASATNRNYQVDQPDGVVGPNMNEQNFNQELVLAYAIAAITLKFESIIDAALGLSNISDAGELERAEHTLRFKMRGIVVLIGQLQESATRTGMAGEVVKMRDHLFGDTGVVKEVEELLARRAALDVQKVEQFVPAETISVLSNQLTAVAQGQIDAARQNLTAVTERMIVILAIASFVSFFAIGWALVFIVERQINKRMASLTKSVLAIAAGETTYDVDVTGPDELGYIASALEVFKMNAQELQRSNTELEKFAYVAAHDLRSPLRAIQDLADWTLEDSDNVFSSEGRENMALLQRRIGRLNQLLSDLLAYSRVGKEADDLTELSIKGILKETAELLDPDDRFHIRFSGSCDSVVTYATPLRQILLNLVSNGIKHHDQPVGSIKVDTHIRSGRIVCSVQDDGPGISPKYHDKIFGLFQTLRSRDEVEGSGLGLAIIRKLLEHYSGSISIQSDPERGRGTIFTFDFPEKSEDVNSINQAA
ncbi:ATP-binding protein [uncultured Thioclava sp.]|uniref:sensor histidine kinase n=1 Tax=uncultured Thioclava sp. TaxID=473858 RepID=UPI0025FB08EC|nr:ATP-binding protein [uncultured Thioclava sp.]